MGYLPRNSTFHVRPVHLRGIKRCIDVLNMTDKVEIAKACLIPEGEIDNLLTPVQKMAIGKKKKAKAKATKKADKDLAELDATEE